MKSKKDKKSRFLEIHDYLDKKSVRTLILLPPGIIFSINLILGLIHTFYPFSSNVVNVLFWIHIGNLIWFLVALILITWSDEKRRKQRIVSDLKNLGKPLSSRSDGLLEFLMVLQFVFSLLGFYFVVLHIRW